MKTPGRWKDFVSSTPEVGTNRRQLMNALRKRYHEPLRQKRGKVGLMQMLYEADDRLWDVEVLVTPIEVKVPSEIEQMHTSLLVHAFERLETLRLFAKEGSKVAKEFYLKCRESAPTAGKKYTELVEKAKERASASTTKGFPGVSETETLQRHRPPTSNFERPGFHELRD